MKRQINALIKQHIDDDSFTDYSLKCSVKDFKDLQRSMRDKYGIENPKNGESMWTHNGTQGNPTRVGVVEFPYGNIRLHVTCETNYDEEPIFKKLNGITSS